MTILHIAFVMVVQMITTVAVTVIMYGHIKSFYAISHILERTIHVYLYLPVLFVVFCLPAILAWLLCYWLLRRLESSLLLAISVTGIMAVVSFFTGIYVAFNKYGT